MARLSPLHHGSETATGLSGGEALVIGACLLGMVLLGLLLWKLIQRRRIE